MSKPPTLVDALTADLASATLAAGPLRARLSSGAPKLQHWLDSEVSANNGEVVLHVGGDEVYTVSDELNADLMSLVDAASHVGCRTAVLRCGPLPGHAELNGGDSSRSPPSLATPARADGRLSAHILIRRTPQSVKDFLETRIAVVGNVDAGKSTLLGVLTKGSLDDGRGRARVNLFRHKHEIESGRTSSVGTEIMGFDAAGQPVNSAHLGRLAAGSSHSSADPLAPLVDEDFSDSPPSANVRKLSWEDVCENSAKVISFIDLAGHENYLKTTLFGMTGCLPDYTILMAGANAGLVGMSREHLGIALALGVPVLVCITKVDMTPPHILEATIKQLVKILRSPGSRKTPAFIHTHDQMVDVALRINGVDRICPIFQVSNVTGQSMGLLRSFLNLLPMAPAAKFRVDAPLEFQISDVFSVPFVGTVVSGVIVSGKVQTGEAIILGPDSLGNFLPTAVRSIQRKRVNVDAGTAGQSVSFALKKIRRNQVRKGMVILGRNDPSTASSAVPATLGLPAAPVAKAHFEFDAEVLCLYHSTTLSIGSCMVLHTASIRQTVRILGLVHLGGAKHRNQVGGGAASQHTDVVRTGDRARLRMRFIRFPEYCKPGQKLITREGKTRLIGVVRAVSPTLPLSVLAMQGDASSPDEAARDGTVSREASLKSSAARVGA